MGNLFSTPKRIVLIGNSGNGKSSAGNTIVGKKEFTTKISANSVTTKCQRSENMVNGKKITVVDTPDFFGTEDDDNIKSEVVRALVECTEGVHAFVIVLKVGRYTHEKKKVQQLLDMLKKDVLKHTVILFTHGEQLEDKTIEEFVKTNPQLQELVDKCGGRCHVIDNRYWKDCDSGYKSNRVQVKNLLDTIDKMEKQNGCFNNELLKKLEEDIQKEMEKNKENLPPEEKREKAKEIVHSTFLSWVVKMAKQALLGALMGVLDVVKMLTEKFAEQYVGKYGSKIIGASVGGVLDGLKGKKIGYQIK